MNLQLVKNIVTSKVARQLLIAKANSPSILFAGGVVGVVATAVLASKSTLKLEDILDEAARDHAKVNVLIHDDYSEEDRRLDHLKITARTAGNVVKLYSPAIAVGVVSIAALTGSHVILTRRNTAVMAAYSALDKGFKEYRARVRKELGDEKDQEFRYGAVTITEHPEEPGAKAVEHKLLVPEMPSIYARFFDEQSSSWDRDPEYNRVFLAAQQRYANDLLHARGHIFLNDVYDMLKLPRSKAGAVVGWFKDSEDGDNFVDFGIFDPNNPRGRMFVNTNERSILLDFNVDGIIYDKLV